MGPIKVSATIKQGSTPRAAELQLQLRVVTLLDSLRQQQQAKQAGFERLLPMLRTMVNSVKPAKAKSLARGLTPGYAGKIPSRDISKNRYAPNIKLPPEKSPVVDANPYSPPTTHVGPYEPGAVSTGVKFRPGKTPDKPWEEEKFLITEPVWRRTVDRFGQPAHRNYGKMTSRNPTHVELARLRDGAEQARKATSTQRMNWLKGSLLAGGTTGFVGGSIAADMHPKGHYIRPVFDRLRPLLGL